MLSILLSEEIKSHFAPQSKQRKKLVDLQEETIPAAHVTLLQIQERECLYKIHQGTSDYSIPSNKISNKRYKCTYHKSKNHTDEECIAQQERKRDIKRKDIDQSKLFMMVIEKEYSVKNMEFTAHINNTIFDNVLVDIGIKNVSKKNNSNKNKCKSILNIKAMLKIIDKIVKKCMKCSKYNTNLFKKDKSNRIESEGRFKRVSTDIFGSFNLSDYNHHEKTDLW
ncbi:hypothetical protein CWI39_1304p0010 [Hamiltosporidium magnivora]|uniref:Uncharacterized protein n=1 Tax=Hamiltosporidium magnivora TaxID=148818 RepID=A0A4Q9L5D1_9MICR|nr:hypothetical protein CWI39_1304p0010 [Hamiltosporidium magnivora]